MTGRAAPNPRRVVLGRTYRFRETEQNKAEDWAMPLWDFLAANLVFELTMTPLRNVELKDVMHERYINYTYSRLIVAGCFAVARMRSYLPSEEEQQEKDRDEALRSAVDMVIDLDEVVRDKIVFYLSRLCPRILGKRAEPTPKQKATIKAQALSAGHRCYLCGRELHFEGRPYGDASAESIGEIRKSRFFTIEHLWSKARGGSRDRSNLGACCQQCNNLKTHLLSFADFPVEQIMTPQINHSAILTDVPAQARLALLWRQGGRCKMCDNRLFDIDPETLYMARREVDEPYHFFNLMAICGGCNEEHELKGVRLRA